MPLILRPSSLDRSVRLARPAALALGLLVLAGPAGDAEAAVWGSFDASRIAYSSGALGGTVHEQLRNAITDHGDEVGSPTSLLTAEYLATIDVFYTAMLSDGTGPTAGALGTLSLDEQMALQDFIAGGGTLIVTPDSNGFDGPFPIVYDSWLVDYGITDFTFVFGLGTGSPVIVHPITQGIGSYGLDGTVSFTYPATAQVLGTADDGASALMAVLEPATGFTEGGRILVVADHNMFTENYIGELGNLELAQNIVEWASGECGNGIVESGEMCDDGNTEDGDGCSASCLGGDGGDSTGGDADTTAGGSDDVADTSGGEPSTGSGMPGGSDGTGATDEGGSGSGLPSNDDADSGCGCRSTGAPASAGWLGLLLLGLRRRSRG